MKEIFGSRTNPEIIGDMVSEFKRADEVSYISIYNKYLPFFWADRSPWTARNLYQEALKAIDNTKIAKAKREAIRRYFNLDTTFFLALNKQTQEREIEAMNDKVEFSVDGYLQKMAALKEAIKTKSIKGHGVQSDEEATANAMVVYVAMATGRRLVEIVQKVQLVKDRSGTYFVGLAKKGENEDRYVAVLLDEDYHFVKKCIDQLRNTLKTETLPYERIKEKYSKIMSRAARKLLEDDVTIHTIRERYAEVCVLTKKPETMDAELYREMVLGHEVKLKASDFYKGQKGIQK